MRKREEGQSKSKKEQMNKEIRITVPLSSLRKTRTKIREDRREPKQ